MQNHSQPALLKVGDLARKTGKSVRALRLYEELGLLQPRTRSDGGFRLYGADEIAVAIAERRWGHVLAALVLAPGLFAASTLGFGVAVLVGQETWLLAAMLLVPAGFLLTAVIIGVQALRRR